MKKILLDGTIIDSNVLEVYVHDEGSNVNADGSFNLNTNKGYQHTGASILSKLNIPFSPGAHIEIEFDITLGPRYDSAEGTKFVFFNKEATRREPYYGVHDRNSIFFNFDRVLSTKIGYSNDSAGSMYSLHNDGVVHTAGHFKFILDYDTKSYEVYKDNLLYKKIILTDAVLNVLGNVIEFEIIKANYETVGMDKIDNLIISYSGVIEEKTLILHDGEYKTITPEIPYSPPVLGAKVALVPNMTSDTAPSGLAFASSFKTFGEPWRAFNSNTTYSWSTPSDKAEGEFLGYIFNNPQKIRAYSIYPVNADTGAPPGWKFQISSDTTNGTDGTWTTVDTRSNQHLINTAASHYNLSKEVEAKAFRIVFNKPTATLDIWIKQIQIYKGDIISPEIPAQPMKIVTVSTAIPTVDQFMEHGMEQLSPLLDRVTKESDPIPMNKIE